MLNQHPRIVNYGEVLGDWTLPGRHFRDRFRSAESYLRWIYKSRAFFGAAQTYSFIRRRREGRPTHFRRWKNVATLGVKELSVNLRNHDLIEPILADRALKIVTLVRENPLERLVSAMLLKHTGVVAQVGDGAKAADDAQVTLDPEALPETLAVYEAENETVHKAARRAGPARSFSLTYEGYFGLDDSARARRDGELLDFLGVPPMRLSKEHRRIRKTPLQSVIANYSAVRDALRGTRYEVWLPRS